MAWNRSGFRWLVGGVVVVLLVAAAGAVLTPSIASAANAWTRQSSPVGSTLHSVTFIDANTGWALGEDCVLHTTNGGATWMQQTIPAGNNKLRSLTFADANTGWVVGYGSILHTTNGGATWTQQPVPTGSDDLSAVTFADANTGWVVGGSYMPFILHTTNGGATWTQQTIPGAPTVNLNSVTFIDANTGWAGAGGYPPGDGTVLHTTNGGQTWTRQHVGLYLSAVTFTDANTGWAVSHFMGGYTGILHTTDGGATWTQQAVPVNMNLRRVTFTDANTGWAVGSGILHTTNGGATWTLETDPDTINNLSSVTFTDANHGWAVGYGGVILAYRDADTINRVLHYAAGAGGTLSGDTSQTILHGRDGSAVSALAATGYHFTGWSDGKTANPRTDTNVLADATYTAAFAKTVKTASIARTPNKSTVTYTRKHGVAKFALSAVIKGWGGKAVTSHYVYLQSSKNGRAWSNTYKLKTSSTGKASKAFKVTTKRVRYYRWYVPAKSQVCLKTYSKSTKATVR